MQKGREAREKIGRNRGRGKETWEGNRKEGDEGGDDRYIEKNREKGKRKEKREER